MDKREQQLQKGMEMGRKTARIVHAILVENPRGLDETQEQYADRIMLLVVQGLARDLGVHLKTQD